MPKVAKLFFEKFFGIYIYAIFKERYGFVFCDEIAYIAPTTAFYVLLDAKVLPVPVFVGPVPLEPEFQLCFGVLHP